MLWSCLRIALIRRKTDSRDNSSNSTRVSQSVLSILPLILEVLWMSDAPTPLQPDAPDRLNTYPPRSSLRSRSRVVIALFRRAWASRRRRVPWWFEAMRQPAARVCEMNRTFPMRALSWSWLLSLALRRYSGSNRLLVSNRCSAGHSHVLAIRDVSPTLAFTNKTGSDAGDTETNY
jgi:hypothetical protein